MFKKLLSNLAFNPSLIGQVSFYAKRMHQESTIRRTGVLMLALALFIQSFAVISPPEPTLANSNNDLIVGGIKSRDGAVQNCNNNTRNYKTILAYYDISCADVGQASTVTIKSTDYNKQLFSMGYVSQGSIIERTGKRTNETPVTIPGVGTVYLRHLWAFDSGAYSNYQALKITKNGKTFFILYSCGNLVTIGLPPAPKPAFTVQKGVNTPGKANFLEDITVKPGEEVVFAIDIKNSGNVKLNKIRFRDTLPSGLVAVNGSLAVDGKKVSALLSSFDLPGETNVGQTRRVTFNAKVALTANACGTNRLRNITIVSADNLPTKQDDATVQACKPKEVPTSTPPVTPPPVTPPPVTPPPVTPETCPYNSALAKDDVACKPCEASQTRDDKTACLEYRKTVRNVTQNIADANGTTANAGDVVEYTLLVTNKGKDKITGFVVEENMSDVLDYSDVVNSYGGTLGEYGNLSWSPQTINANETVRKQILVKIKSPIPQTPVSASDPGHFDLTMTNTYGNTVSVKLPPTIIKTAEITTKTLPNTGPGESLAAVVLLTMFVSYFFARSRLMAKELDIVRTDFSATGGY